MLKKTIRKGDDFKVVITFKDREGVTIDSATQLFKYIYRDIFGNSYEVSYDGITRVNCIINDSHLVGIFENYTLTSGVLKREEYYHIQDNDFSDGLWNHGQTVQSGIELTQYGGIREVEEVIEMIEGICINETLVVSKGDKGDPFIYEDFTFAQLAELKGDTGIDGLTPYVGVDDCWWIGDNNTGVKAVGIDGVTFTPSVDVEGNISWSNDGGINNPPTQNIQGIQGLQGFSSYDLAVKAGYRGTEAQFGAEQAAVAANSARLEAVEVGKANLDNNGYVASEHIDPLQGKQTGVELVGNSRYTKVLPNEIAQQLVSASFSIECYFEWDGASNTDTFTHNIISIEDQYRLPVVSIYRQSSGATSFHIKNRRVDDSQESVSLTNKTLRGINHVILVVDRFNQVFTGYLNGVKFNAKPFTQAVSIITEGTFNIGASYIAARPFTAKHSRIFNYVLSQEDVNRLYNSGNPHDYMLPASEKCNVLTNHILNSENKYVWDGASSGYYRKIDLTSTLYPNRDYQIRYRISDYVSGAPFLLLGSSLDGNASVVLQRQNGDFEVIAKCITPFSNPSILLYGGAINSDRRLTIEVLSVKQIGSIAEYLPCGLLADGWRDTSGNGNDLTAMGSVALSYGKRYSGSMLTPLFVAQGVVYNDKTGYYEYNGLTDITETQMCEIYYRSTALLGGNWMSAFYYSSARTAIFKMHLDSTADATECFRNSAVEKLQLSCLLGNNDISPKITSGYLMFHSATKLRAINGQIRCDSLTNVTYMFTGCALLGYVNLKYLKISISLKDSPLLLRECVLYAITNASNTTPITLTLHADAFAGLSEADIALASSKNITIAA